MTQFLRIRVAKPILIGLLLVAVAAPVLPNAHWFGGVAYAEDCGDSTCG